MFMKSVALKWTHMSKARISCWSNLGKTFNSRPSTNINVIKKDVGLFGVEQLISPEGFFILADKCMTNTNYLVEEAISSRRSRKVVEILDELSDTLCQVADLAEFIRFAHPSSKYSRAAENASISISQLVEKLNTNVKLYQSLKKTVINDDIIPQTEVDKLVGSLFLFDFEQSGIHLPEDKRNQVVELNNTILCVGQQFVHGISNPKVIRRDNLPEAVRNVFPNEGDRVVVSGLYADSSNPIIREMAYRIFLYPDPSQEVLLQELLTARDHLAKVCDFQTYAERALRGSILNQPSSVMQLLENLSDLIRPKVENDFAEMLTAKHNENPSHEPLAVWDVPYFTQNVKKARFQVCSKEYSPYFSLGACMEGLNIIFTALYGISLVHTEIEAGETWSKDVYKLAVQHETQGVLGYIYCDFYERHGKPNQDCHFTIRGGKRLKNGHYQIPIVVLMLNYSLPKWSSPTLLSPNMVDNLFHEMGHAMHSMLARTQYQHVSGTRCSTDFAEVPSILMEYFASDYRVLKLFAKHFQTQEAMPEAMIRRLCASKRLFTASETQLQVFYSALDQIYHSRPVEGGASTRVLEEAQNRFYGLPYVTNTAWQLRFSHLVGYGAKYYSYLVSKALAHLIWEGYFKGDPLSRKQGERYREECLGYGGGKHPTALISDFLGIEPRPELLAKSLNDEIEADQSYIADAGRKVYAFH